MKVIFACLFCTLFLITNTSVARQHHRNQKSDVCTYGSGKTAVKADCCPNFYTPAKCKSEGYTLWDATKDRWMKQTGTSKSQKTPHTQQNINTLRNKSAVSL